MNKNDNIYHEFFICSLAINNFLFFQYHIQKKTSLKIQLYYFIVNVLKNSNFKNLSIIFELYQI